MCGPWASGFGMKILYLKSREYHECHFIVLDVNIKKIIFDYFWDYKMFRELTVIIGFLS